MFNHSWIYFVVSSLFLPCSKYAHDFRQRTLLTIIMTWKRGAHYANLATPNLYIGWNMIPHSFNPPLDVKCRWLSPPNIDKTVRNTEHLGCSLNWQQSLSFHRDWKLKNPIFHFLFPIIQLLCENIISAVPMTYWHVL